MEQTSVSPSASTRKPHPRARKRVPVYSDNPDSLERKVDYLKRTATANLAELPDSWRPAAELMHLDRVQAGREPSSWTNWSWSLVVAARDLGGKDPASITALDLRRVVARWLTEPNAACDGRPLKRSTVSTRVNHLRPFLASFHPHEELPADMKKALKVSKGSDKLKGRVITDGEFTALLEAATNERLARKPRQVALKVALLWCLKDAGGRVSELLGVNQGDAQLSRPTATLFLRTDAPLLKSGAREINLLEACGPLGVWLDMHPAQGDPNAPLFCNLRDAGRPIDGPARPCRRMSDNTVDQLLKRWARAAGLQPRDDHLLSSKDFRHTKATVIAKAGWDPVLKKLHMGWSKESNMDSQYTHLDGSDVRERLKRDYGVDEQGFRMMTEAADPVELLARVLDLMDQRRHGNPLRTQRPPEHLQR